MRFVKGLVIAATTAFFMACGGGNSPADKMMAFQDKLLSIVESNKSDLDKAATEVKAYVEANKGDLQNMMAEMGKMAEELQKDPEKLAKMMEEFKGKQEAMEKRMEALEKEVPGLKDHAGLKEAMSGLQM